MVRKGLIDQLDVKTHIFSLSFTGEDTLIAYTVSDGTYLIFGGRFNLILAYMQCMYVGCKSLR